MTQLQLQQQIQLYPLWLRLWHWFNAISFLILILSGASLHFSGQPFLLNFNTARILHNFFGMLLAINYLLFILGNFFMGNWRFYRPQINGLLKCLLLQLRYYAYGVFIGEDKPFHSNPNRKFNPLQQLAYLMIMYGAMPILIISGMVFFFPELAPDKIMGMDGLWPIAVVHYLMGVLLTAFLISHLYLITIGKELTHEMKKMLFGYQVERHVNHQQSENNKELDSEY